MIGIALGCKTPEGKSFITEFNHWAQSCFILLYDSCIFSFPAIIYSALCVQHYTQVQTGRCLVKRDKPIDKRDKFNNVCKIAITELITATNFTQNVTRLEIVKASLFQTGAVSKPCKWWFNLFRVMGTLIEHKPTEHNTITLSHSYHHTHNC